MSHFFKLSLLVPGPWKKSKANVSPLDDVLVFFPTKFFGSKRVGPHTTVAKSLRIRDDVNEKWGLLLNPGDLVECNGVG